MSLTARLNDDVLLYLLKFLNPTEQLDLILSGVLQGFEIPIHNRRSEGILIKLKYSSQKIIIESLKCSKFDKSNRNILKKMLTAGYLGNVWKLDLDFEKRHIENALTLDDLGCFFHFCPKLTHLCIQMEELWQYKGKSQMHADLASELSQGFNRLERIQLDNCLRYLFLNSWPIYQEILTWCGECKELSILESSAPIESDTMTMSPLARAIDLWRPDISQQKKETFGFDMEPTDPYLFLVPTNPDFGQKLQKLDFRVDFSDEMLQWLLPYCRNLHTFIDSVKWGRPDVGLNEFLHLKNLRNLSISTPTPIQLYEIFRNFLHLEALNVEFSTSNCEGGLIDVLMEPADNMILDLKLTCHFSAFGNTMVRMNGSIGEILPVFKKWQHLRRLALVGCRPIDLMEEEWIMNPWRMPSAAECPSLNLVCDFILDMKGLTYLSITDDFNDEEMMALKVEVDDWVKLHRPGFIFEMRNSKTLSSDDCWYSF